MALHSSTSSSSKWTWTTFEEIQLLDSSFIFCLQPFVGLHSNLSFIILPLQSKSLPVQWEIVDSHVTGSLTVCSSLIINQLPSESSNVALWIYPVTNISPAFKMLRNSGNKIYLGHCQCSIIISLNHYYWCVSM